MMQAAHLKVNSGSYGNGSTQKNNSLSPVNWALI